MHKGASGRCTKDVHTAIISEPIGMPVCRKTTATVCGLPSRPSALRGSARAHGRVHIHAMYRRVHELITVIIDSRSLQHPSPLPSSMLSPLLSLHAYPMRVCLCVFVSLSLSLSGVCVYMSLSLWCVCVHVSLSLSACVCVLCVCALTPARGPGFARPSRRLSGSAPRRHAPCQLTAAVGIRHRDSPVTRPAAAPARVSLRLAAVGIRRRGCGCRP